MIGQYKAEKKKLMGISSWSLSIFNHPTNTFPSRGPRLVTGDKQQTHKVQVLMVEPYERNRKQISNQINKIIFSNTRGLIVQNDSQHFLSLLGLK